MLWCIERVRGQHKQVPSVPARPPHAARCWLQESVATGSHCWRQQLGLGGGADVFAHIYRTDADRLRFMRGMHAFAALSAPALVRAVDLSGALQLTDLGGATGALAVAALEAYPCLWATVVDLPGVVEAAQKHFYPQTLGGRPARPGVGGAVKGSGSPCSSGGGSCIRDPSSAAGTSRGAVSPGVLSRLSWVGADMFQERGAVPGDADVCVLSRILHDWDAARCRVG
jgi:hypothetical protein